MIECDVKCWCFNPYTMWALALQMEMGPHKDRGKLWPGWELNPRHSGLITTAPPTELQGQTGAGRGKWRCKWHGNTIYLTGWYTAIQYTLQADTRQYNIPYRLIHGNTIYLTGWFNNYCSVHEFSLVICLLLLLSRMSNTFKNMSLTLLSALICSNCAWQGKFQFVSGDVISFEIWGIQHHNVTNFLLWFSNMFISLEYQHNKDSNVVAIQSTSRTKLKLWGCC